MHNTGFVQFCIDLIAWMAKNWKSSVLFSLIPRNDSQLPGSLLVASTFLRIPGRRGAVVKRVEHISIIVLVNI